MTQLHDQFNEPNIAYQAGVPNPSPNGRMKLEDFVKKIKITRPKTPWSEQRLNNYPYDNLMAFYRTPWVHFYDFITLLLYDGNTTIFESSSGIKIIRTPMQSYRI